MVWPAEASYARWCPEKASSSNPTGTRSYRSASAWQRPLALILGVVLLVETAYVLFTQADQISAAAALPDGFGTPFEIGKLLFSQYLLPFEVTSVLLLVAMIGAIVLTRQEKKK